MEDGTADSMRSATNAAAREPRVQRRPIHPGHGRCLHGTSRAEDTSPSRLLSQRLLFGVFGVV